MTIPYHPLTSRADVDKSVRLTMLTAVLRHVVKRRLRSLPITAASVAARRRQINGIARRWYGKPPKGVRYESGQLHEVPVEYVIPDTRHERAVLYIHGGAFVLCSPLTHRGITARLARDLSCDVVVPDYRLAPEHCYPAAVNDVLNVYRAMLEERPASAIALAGDSAGGNLVLALLHAIKAEGLDLPSSAVCLSPWTDLTGASDSIRTNIERDALLPGERMHELALLYLDGAYVREPTASPVYGDFSGFPPLLFHVGDEEILLDDTLRVAARARRQGVAAHVRIWPYVPHVFHAFSLHLPVARDALREVAEFIREQFRLA